MSRSSQTQRRLRYEEYLASPEWASVRRSYQLNREWRCFCCPAKRRLHLHHKTYERLGREALDDLIPLCQKHHADVHKLVSSGVAPLATAHIVLSEKGRVVLVEAKQRRRKAKRARKTKGSRKLIFNAEPVICMLCENQYPKHHPSLRCECGGFLRFVSSTPENRISKFELAQKRREEERQRIRAHRQEQAHLRPHLRSKA